MLWHSGCSHLYCEAETFHCSQSKSEMNCVCVWGREWGVVACAYIICVLHVLYVRIEVCTNLASGRMNIGGCVDKIGDGVV